MKKVGDSCSFTGGAEETPKVTVEQYRKPGSMQDGDLTLKIEQNGQTVCLSPGTMLDILTWFNRG